MTTTTTTTGGSAGPPAICEQTRDGGPVDGGPVVRGPASPLPAIARRLGDQVPVAVLLAVPVLVVLTGRFLPGSASSLSWVLVAAGLLFGLPHGAVDHLVPAWARARRLPLPATAGLVAGYVLVAAVMLVVLRAAPTAGLLLFLVLSLWHFGTGELAYQQLRADTAHTRDRMFWRAAGVLAWGGTSVLLPLTVHTSRVLPVLDALAPGAGALLTPALRVVVTAGVLLAAAAWTLVAVRQRRRRAAVELAVLVAVFLTVPPLVAFAAYFGGWHAVRHLARLLATDPGNAADLTAGRLAAPLRRFAGQAALPTLLALSALVVLLACSWGRVSLLAADVTLLAALTVPHMVVVGWLDRQPRRGLPRTLLTPTRGGRA